jgi:hypothetical protein
MKILLVAAKDEFFNLLSFHLTPLGSTLEHARDPVRAIENIDSIDPQCIIFHTGDFPRHWKPLLSLVRMRKSKEETVFILATPKGFELEEAAKAAHLGANGIVGLNLSDKKELYRLEEIFRRYRAVEDKRNFTRFVPLVESELGFMFTNPRRLALVTGKIREISIQGASFLPLRASSVEDLSTGDQLPRCSLKIGDEIVSATCKLTRNRDELGLQFISLEEEGRKALLGYIKSRSERALKSATAARN